MERRPLVLAFGLLAAVGAGAGTWYGDDIARALRSEPPPSFGEVGGTAQGGTLEARAPALGALTPLSAPAPTTSTAPPTTAAPSTAPPVTEPPTTTTEPPPPPTTAPPPPATDPPPPPPTEPPPAPTTTAPPPPTTTIDPPPPPTTMPPIAFTAFQWSGESSADPPWDKFWGTASPGATVTVTSDHGSNSVVADGLGHWFVKVYFPTAPFDEYIELSVSDGTTSQAFPFMRTSA
jgi:hypothetical protein